MRKSLIPLFVSGAFLAACASSMNPALISQVPAPAAQFQEAQRAAEICSDHAPDWKATEAAFLADGYHESADKRLSGIARSQKSAILEKDGFDTVIQVGSRGGEGACLVGLRGMTPEQSYELALPWVAKYDGLTNAEQGQGLAENAQQAWGHFSADRIVYLAAYKTWDVLDEPGAAARLLYIRKR